MAELLNTALTGLLTYQRALSTTSHNIANVNTPGYSRQRTEFATRTPQFVAGHTFGRGVQIANIQRIYDQFLNTALQGFTSENSRLEIFHQMTEAVDNILATSSGGIDQHLQAFFDAVQDVADDPSSIPARIGLLSTADILVTRFQSVATQIEDQANLVNDQLRGISQEINSLSFAIRDVNGEILDARAVNGGQTPADLADKLDVLLTQLAKKVSISTISNHDGTTDVFIGNGQTLVSNRTAFTLTTIVDPADTSRLRVTYAGTIGVVDITGALSGGELGGVLDFRRDVLDPARNNLGRIAVALSETFNAQHRDGMDLNGALGTDFFSVPAPNVITHGANTGAATVTAGFTDVTQLTLQDYQLSFDGANWTLAATNGTSTVTGAGPTLTLDGFSVNIAGVAVAGDRFLVQPTRLAASNMQTLLTDVNTIAAASPIVTGFELANLGNAQISAGEVLDVTDPNLLNSVRVEFTSATTYNLVNPATGVILLAAQPYTPGANIDFNGWRIQISGTPQAGDRFNVQSNAGGTSDNRNALRLAALQSTGILDNGFASYLESYSTFVADIGTQTQQAEIARDAQSSLLTHTQESRNTISGVNLDEEATDMIRYQQAYQAMARVMTIASSLFDVLLDTV